MLTTQVFPRNIFRIRLMNSLQEIQKWEISCKFYTTQSAGTSAFNRPNEVVRMQFDNFNIGQERTTGTSRGIRDKTV